MEESRGPTDFGKEEDDNLSNDQEAIEDGPEDTGGLVGNGRVTVKTRQRGRVSKVNAYVRDIIVAEPGRIGVRERVWVIWSVLVGVEGLDILDECHDAAREDEDEGDDAQSSDDVQPNEHI